MDPDRIDKVVSGFFDLVTEVGLDDDECAAVAMRIFAGCAAAIIRAADEIEEEQTCH